MKIFQKSLMASEDVKSLLISGKYYVGTVATQINDGAVVAIGDLVDNEAYTGKKNHNIRKVTAPAATTDEIGFVDLAEISEGTIGGNTYKIGFKTAGLTASAGKAVRIRKVLEGDTFYLGAENFDTAPTIGEYAILEAGEIAMKATDDLTGYTGTYLTIEDSEKLTQGTVAGDTIYFCRVHKA